MRDFRLVVLYLCLSLSLSAGASKVRVNLNAKRLPELPFPNDIMTRRDQSSPTGRRLHIPLRGKTKLETRLRLDLEQLDGFSTYGPITISFTEALDRKSVKGCGRVQKEDLFKDQCLLVAELSSGKPQPLDIGQGHFPVVLEKTDQFINDYRAKSSNMLFETENEAGRGKDTNFDGRLFKPNLFKDKGDRYTDLMTQYDRNSYTLIARPLLPLKERTKYIVLLTRKIHSESGEPIASPFKNPYFPQQGKSVRKFLKTRYLRKLGLHKKDVVFAWIFTTGTTTDELFLLREGLYGQGVFAKLKEEYPIEEALRLDPLRKAKTKKMNIYTFPAKNIAKLADVIGQLFGFKDASKELGLSTIDYIVSGSFASPNFLVNSSGYPGWGEEMFHLNITNGSYRAKEEQVTFVLSVPKEGPNFHPPFPVILLSHGYTGNRLTALLVAGIFARHGFAVLGLDAAGHGPESMKEEMDKYLSKKNRKELLKSLGMERLMQSLFKGRSRDLDGDGVPDSGADYWTAFVFHTRDMVRQTALDYVRAVQIFRSFDGTRRWSLDLNEDGTPDLAGDFNLDGKVDVGGDQPFGMIGFSLGGIVTEVTAPLDPYIQVAVPVIGGGGLSDIGIRSVQGGVPQAVTLRIMGPLVISYKKNGETVLAFQVTDLNHASVVDIAPVKLKRKDRVEVINIATGETAFAIADRQGRIRINIAADVHDPLEILVKRRKRVVTRIREFQMHAAYQSHTFKKGDDLVAPVAGFGLKRNTPEYLRFFAIAQMVLDPGDPINYAPKYILDPYPFTIEGKRETNLLAVPSIGDMNVPVNTEIAFARAAGLLPITISEASQGIYYYGEAKDPQRTKSYQEWLASKMSWNEWMKAHGRHTTPDKALLDIYAVEGLEKLRRLKDTVQNGVCRKDNECRFEGKCKKGVCYPKMLADVDNISFSKSGFSPPLLDPPLRIIRKTATGVSGMRIPYYIPTGSHGFGFDLPEYDGVKATFHVGQYMANQIALYFRSGGKILVDAPCLEKDSKRCIESWGR